MGQLADRLAVLARRYGSDASAWQHEIHALAALEESDVKAAVERFHELKRRFADFQRAQLLRELRAYPFVSDVPSGSTRGYPMNELEADIREATRALGHARDIARALAEEAEARAGLTLRALPPAEGAGAARWDALAPLAGAMEERRRLAMREARLDRRLVDAARRARKLAWSSVAAPDATLAPDALDAALDAVEEALRDAEALDEAHREALAPLKSPEVGTYRHESRRALESEAAALAKARDVAGLRALAPRAEALRREAAGAASGAARARRRGGPAPARERKPGDTMDGYG